MRVHFSGGPQIKHSTSKRGSYEMRGRQIAATRPNWTADWESGCYPDKIDVFVTIKKFDPRALSASCSVYDIVDAWGQKRGHDVGERFATRRQIIKYFKDQWLLSGIAKKFNGWIFPNATMRKDLRRACPVPLSAVIYHHYHPGIKINPIREKLTKIGYQGKKQFLGEWEGKIRSICDKMNIEFVINPEHLADVDAVVAVRGGTYGNIMTRSYKSNVKLANCYGSGTPALMYPEASYQETDNGFVNFFKDEEQFIQQLESLHPYDVRKNIHEKFLDTAPSYSVETIAQHYEEFFKRLLDRRSAA